MNIQIVFYWVATIALALFGLFMIIATIMLFYIKSQITRMTRTVETAVGEIQMAIEDTKSRARGFGAEIMSNFWGSVLNMIRKN